MRIGAYLVLAGVFSLPACAGAQPGGWGFESGPRYHQPYAQYAPEYQPRYVPPPFVGGRETFYGRDRRDWDQRYRHDNERDGARRQQEIVRQQEQYNQRLLRQQQQYNATVLKQQQYNNALLQQQQAYNAAKLAQERAAAGR